MAKTAFNPDGLPVPRGSYSLVNVAQPGRMVFIAGQTASDHEGKVVGLGDPKAQARFILGKIQRAVEAAGGTMNDVVALSVFTTDVRYHPILTRPGARSWGRTSRPARRYRWRRWHDPSCCSKSTPSR
jgi:enamine deaminase RidA (YjgF/YER057c/UK114 family)